MTEPLTPERVRLRAALVVALDNANHTHPCPVTGSAYWTGCYHPDRTSISCHSERRADAVLTVLDAELDRAVRASADWLEGIGQNHAADMLRYSLEMDAEMAAAVTEKASTPVPTATPDFFQPAHTYQRRRWHFQCLATAPNPFNDEVLALGFLYRPGEPATATALDPDDWEHGEWTELTRDGA